MKSMLASMAVVLMFWQLRSICGVSEDWGRGIRYLLCR